MFLLPIPRPPVSDDGRGVWTQDQLAVIFRIPSELVIVGAE